jgi:hypothetical protein
MSAIDDENTSASHRSLAGVGDTATFNLFEAPTLNDMRANDHRPMPGTMTKPLNWVGDAAASSPARAAQIRRPQATGSGYLAKHRPLRRKSLMASREAYAEFSARRQEHLPWLLEPGGPAIFFRLISAAEAIPTGSLSQRRGISAEDSQDPNRASPARTRDRDCRREGSAP